MPPTSQQLTTGLNITAGHWSDPGRQRPENEDCYGVAASRADDRLAQRGYLHIVSEQQLAERGRLFVVADGVGGHNAGATASSLATQVIFQEYYRGSFVEPRVNLSRAIDAANQAILAQSQSGDAALADMGTTVVAAVVRGGEAIVAHVGDSRCYGVNATGARQLTQDHTWVVGQLQAGVLSVEEAQRHPYRHVLTRSLGRADAAPDVAQLAVQPGDRLVLCSDGLSNLVAPHEIQAVVLRHPPQAAAEQLIALANQRGGSDNITALVVQVGQEMAPQSGGILDELSAWLASLPRTWLTAGVLGFAAIACAALLAINGVVGALQGATPTPTKTPTAAAAPSVRTSSPAATPVPPGVLEMAPSATPDLQGPSPDPSLLVTPEQPIASFKYTVQSGDTLSVIAEKFGCDMQIIVEENHLPDPNKIYRGQQLDIPPPCKEKP